MPNNSMTVGDFNLQLLTTSEELRKFRDQWEKLYNQNIKSSPYLCFDWVCTLHEHYRKDYDLCITVLKKGPEIIAIIKDSGMSLFNKKKNILKGGRGLIFLAFSLSFCVSFFVIFPLNAQEIGSPVRYESMIVADEEEVALSFPSYVMVESFMNEIYLLDGRQRILIFTSDSFPLYTLDKNDGIHNPQGIAVDPNGKLYVAQSSTKNYPGNRISVFNACFKWERDIYLKGFEGAESFIPFRMALDKKGNIYISEEWFPGIIVINNEGDFIDIVSPEEDKRKVNINNLILDKDGRIYLVSAEEGRIYVYDKNRKFLFKFGEKGGSSGKLSQPRAIGIDELAGRLYVVDYMRHAINVYNTEGEFLFEFGGKGWSEGWFQFPIDLFVDKAGRVLVADFFNRRVQIFRTR